LNAATEAAGVLPVDAACDAVGASRATFYRRRKADAAPAAEAVTPKQRPARRLSDEERQVVLDTLRSERFVDASPGAVHATLLEEGTWLCSERTMYRIMTEVGENRERRDQLTHPPYAKPELLATKPNEVWTWDITKLRGPAKWTYYYLYVIIDVFSRYVVGWMVAERECASLARRLFEETCAKQGIVPGQLTVHADRGAPMTSKLLAQMLADLGVTKSHSRPHVSDDNPFSESHFKTMKYRPEFPDRFDSLEDAKAFCRRFFEWYNEEHRHSGIAMMTPAQVHHGEVATVLEKRRRTLEAAWRAHPERFVSGPPVPAAPPDKVWINPPAAAIEHEVPV
jgi:putative transposase